MSQEKRKNGTGQIWRELSDRLRQFVSSRVASAADVDDILQAVFLRIHLNIDGLRQSERLESWVFQITRNAISDHFRKKPHMQDAAAIVDESSDSHFDNLNAQIARCLAPLIERLPEDQRRALLLYEFDGVSQKDVAIRESISLSGAKSRIQRGRKALEGMLKACCEFQFDSRGNVIEYKATNQNCCDEECE